MDRWILVSLLAVLALPDAVLASDGAVTGPTHGVEGRPPAATQAGRRLFVAALPFAQDAAAPTKTDETGGAEIAVAFAAKWRRIKGYEVIDRYAVGEAMARLRVPRGADAPLAMIRALADELALDYVVYGSVKMAEAPRTMSVRVFARKIGKVIVEKDFSLARPTGRRFAIERAITAATGHDFYHPSEKLAILDAASVSAWKANPNLVPNPSFSQGAAGRLAKWEAVIAGKRYGPVWTDHSQAPVQQDVTKMVLWSPAPGDPGAKALQYAMPGKIGNTYGLACYSDWIPVTMGDRYRFAVTYQSDGVVMKNFIKGYALIGTKDGSKPQRREVYRRQCPGRGNTKGKWETLVVDLVPSVLSPKPSRKALEVKWLRIDLYCYLGSGRLHIKDIALRLVEQAGPDGKVANPVDSVAASQPAFPEK